MVYRYTTPSALRSDLAHALVQAGFAYPVCTKPRYRTVDNRECLEASVFAYSTVRMRLETLEGYERVLRTLPGVVATRIIHEDEGTLRDQVVVVHLRGWNDDTKV